MDFQILGSFEVLDDGAVVRIPAGRERALLALLLVKRGRVVSVDAIVHALWGESPPGTAAKAVQGYVSHLRRLLPEGAIVTRPPGYVLEVGGEEVNAARSERLATEGRQRLDEGDDTAAADALQEALALWRGPALADFAYDEFAQDEIRRLEELRLGIHEDRAEALLRAGRTAGLAAELDALVAAHPLRERLRSLAMLALYREGRQADALEMYDAGRRVLAAELGVDPGPELARAHRAILTQDPELGGPVRDAPPVQPAPGSAPPRPGGRRGAVILAGAAVALVVVAVLVLALTRDSGGVEITLPAVVAIDPATNEVVASVAAGSRPVAVAADDKGVWVGDARDGTITRIDAANRTVTRTAGIGEPAIDLALGAGSLWAATGGFGEVVRIDPELGAVAQRIPLGDPGDTVAPTVSSIAADNETVWAGAEGGIVPIDAATGTAREPVNLGRASALQIAVGGDAVWATTLRRRAKRIEKASAQVTADFYAGTFILPVALDGDAVWVGAADEGRLWRFDAATGATQLTTRAGKGSNGIAVGADAIWVASWADGTVVRLDRRTGDVEAVIPVGGAPEDIAVGGVLVWVAVPEGPAQ